MNKSHLDELCGVFARLKTRREALNLLRDVLTPRELASVIERWQIVKRLTSGMPQRGISRDLKVSISKVTRGSQALRHAHGGFQKFLKKS